MSALRKSSATLEAAECICMGNTNTDKVSDINKPDEYLTQNDVQTLKTYFGELDLSDLPEVEQMLMRFANETSTFEHFTGYVSAMID